MKRVLVQLVLGIALVVSLAIAGFADTIHLKDGSVIRGQVVSFKDQQFTVLVGNSTRGRRSKLTLYMEDVEWIEFDSPQGTSTISGADDNGSQTSAIGAPSRTSQSPPSSIAAEPDTSRPAATDIPVSSTPTAATQPSSGSSARIFVINVRVRGDSSNNGWTNSGLVVRKGQRLKISATGRVSLGQGRVSTPAGLPTLPDKDKLMRNEATGGMIAVIGDDNDDFIFIGANRDFVAQRDGVLFLGVNEGNLSDNSGAYDVRIEAEAIR